MTREKHALVAFGANLAFGNFAPENTIRSAISVLRDKGIHAEKLSALYRTPCFPMGAGPDYVNAAAVLRVPAQMTPEAIMSHLHAVEEMFGRRRDTRWGMRTLDIDLLAIDDLVVPDAAVQTRWRDLPPTDQAKIAPDQLILPHPRLQDRAFVLVPLADVAADWVHPLLRQSVAEMLSALPQQDRADVHEIAGQPSDSGVVKPPHRA